MNTEDYSRTKRREFRGTLITFIVAAVVALSLRLFVFEFANVRGPSMEPLLYTGEVVFIEKVSKQFSLPGMGDIVVCDFPNHAEPAIKRVMGLPGDRVAITDGIFFLNGEPYSNDVFKDTMDSDMKEIVVPDDCIFVMGDNRNRSTDSRDVSCGPIPRSAIIGKSLCVIWPLDKITSL